MKADLIKSWLSSEGYKYDIVDNNIHFKYQGKHMFFTVDEDDDMFFRLLMPNIYQVEGNRGKVLEACNEITSSLKVVKAFLVDDHLFMSIEMFVDSTPEVGDFFERCCDILLTAYHKGAQEIL